MKDLGSREDDARADTLTESPGRDAPPPGEPIDWTGRDKDRDRGPFAFLRELPILILVAFVLALLIKTFLVQAFFIPSESMLPTLKIGDRVLVNKVVYNLHPPRRGDIIVFAEPHPGLEEDRSWWGEFTHWLTDGLGVTQDPTKDYIKRVIGLPGETIEVRDGDVFVDGRPLNEPYLSEIEDTSTFPPHLIAEGMLFVMGDNRTNSQDSRSLLGDIPLEKVVGKAFVVIWPPSGLRWLPGT
ncbi:MAG: signal peptidase I [Actinomycetota bacterium]